MSSGALESTSEHWVSPLPTYQHMFPAQGTSLLRSFSLFSLFRSSSATETPNAAALDTLLALSDNPDPPHQHVVKAISSFANFLTQLVQTIEEREEEGLGEEELGWLLSALSGYLVAFKLGAKIVWGSQDHQTLRDSLKDSIDGVLITYEHLSNLKDHHFHPLNREDVLEKTRKSLLASIFPPLSASDDDPHDHLVPLFERARHLVTCLQVALRPVSHAKSHARSSPPPLSVVTDSDALHIMSLLQAYAGGIESIGVLSGIGPSEKKAEKEADKRRPLRIAMEARVLSCDVATSMANREIKHIKTRAKKALLSGEGEPGDVKPELTAESTVSHTVQWEDKVEEELISILNMARDLLEERRGDVLTDRLERHDWLEDIPREGDSTDPRSPQWKDASSSVGDETEEESDSEDDDDDDDDAVDAYPCPLRSLFRLHDRYEEQRLAVWMSLPPSSRSGMGTYMRGDGGKVGEAWDAMGLLLMIEYGAESLLNQGLSRDKLDKWLDLASKRNVKKIRRGRGPKTI